MNRIATVYLVGAGPGDPDLLTVRALRLIESAEVIVYDRLVSRQITELIPSGVTRIYVGKEPGRHSMPQDEINSLLVRLAKTGHRVVRLKGGDPFLFGRGGEEALALRQHDVPFEVVPGITSAAACGTYAGIPLTHRGIAEGVQIVTGHCRVDVPLDLDWAALASPRLTLAIYMGLASAGEIAARLIGAGREPGTPVAIIEQGTTRDQRRILTRLDQLEQALAEHTVHSPAMILIGEVVTLANELDWFHPVQTSESEMQVEERGIRDVG